MFRPFQADSTETLWCLLCCVVLELCRRAKLTDGETVPIQGECLHLRVEGFHTELPEMRQSHLHQVKRQLQCQRRSPTPWMWTSLPWKVMQTCSLASSQCTIHLIGRLMKRSWKLFPGTVPAAIAGPDRPDRRRKKKCVMLRCCLPDLRCLELITWGCILVCRFGSVLGRRPPVCLTYPFAVMSGERPSSRESHATSTLASDSSDGSFVQGPAEETSARGSFWRALCVQVFQQSLPVLYL